MTYDCIVIGGGPAGITASIYAACRALDVLVLDEGKILGGTIGRVSKVSHFPGLMDGETGESFTNRMVKQAEEEGVTFKNEKVVRVDLSAQPKIIETETNRYAAKAVILATGGRPKAVGFQGEDHRVSYWAMKDAPRFKDQVVYVIGGGDATLKECLYLATIAREVHIVHALDSFQAIPDFQKKVENTRNITVHFNTEVVAVDGNEENITSITLKDKTCDALYTETADANEAFGVFVYIGNAPANDLVEGILALEEGYIPTNQAMATSIDGVFACGDIRPKAVRQVATAAADGAIAGIQAKAFINSLEQ